MVIMTSSNFSIRQKCVLCRKTDRAGHCSLRKADRDALRSEHADDDSFVASEPDALDFRVVNEGTVKATQTPAFNASPEFGDVAEVRISVHFVAAAVRTPGHHPRNARTSRQPERSR
jgi:hypothetical protein